MRRRSFLASLAASAWPIPIGARGMSGHDDDRIFATPEAARKSPRETIAYVAAVSSGPGPRRPD